MEESTQSTMAYLGRLLLSPICVIIPDNVLGNGKHSFFKERT